MNSERFWLFARPGPQLRQSHCCLCLEGRDKDSQCKNHADPRIQIVRRICGICGLNCEQWMYMWKAMAEQFCLKLQQDGLTVSIEQISGCTLFVLLYGTDRADPF